MAKRKKTARKLPLMLLVGTIICLLLVGLYISLTLGKKKESSSSTANAKNQQAIPTAQPQTTTYMNNALRQLDDAQKLANKLSQQKTPSNADQTLLLNLMQGAIQDGRKAVELEPRNSSTWYTLSRIYRAFIGHGQGADEYARTTLEEAISIDPKNDFYLFELASLYIQLEQYDNAVQELNKAIVLRPQHANYYYNLGFVYKKQGNLEQAKEAYMKALQYLPKDSPDRKKLEEELKPL